MTKYTPEEIAEAVKSAEYAPCASCATHIPLRVLASALRDAQAEVEAWKKENVAPRKEISDWSQK